MTFTSGSQVGHYTLTTDLTTRDAGTSRWGFAARGGAEFFLKQHTGPKYPVDGAAGSPAVKARRRILCEGFERRKRRLMSELNLVGKDGAIVPIIDFFREGAFYYTVTEKVSNLGLSMNEIADLPLGERLVIMATASKALAALHSRSIVHGDVKPENVLIRKTEVSYTARLIDFDTSFVESDPPAPDLIGGTPEYYAPEVFRYLAEGEGHPTLISTACDVFALGIVFHQYLYGSRPRIPDSRPRQLGAAILDGYMYLQPKFPLAESDATAVAGIIERMLFREPTDRPTMRQVNQWIKDVRRGRIGDGIRESSYDGPLADRTVFEPPSTLKLPRRLRDRPSASSAKPTVEAPEEASVLKLPKRLRPSP